MVTDATPPAFVSHVAAADKARIAALYRDNDARAPGGPGARLDAWLQRRQRRLIEQAAAFAPGQTVLDVGAGQGALTAVARRAGAHVTAVDLVPQLVVRLRDVADVALQGDLESLPLGGTYQRVLAIGVLDFVVQPAAALKKLAALTAVGGRLLVLVPTLSAGGLFYRFEKWCRGVHVNIYRPAFCRQVLQGCGMRLVEMRRPLPSNVLMTWEKN